MGTNFAASVTLHRHLKRTLPSFCRWMSSRFCRCFSKYRQFAVDQYGAHRQCVLLSLERLPISRHRYHQSSSYRRWSRCRNNCARRVHSCAEIYLRDVIFVPVCADRWDKSSHIASHLSVIPKPSLGARRLKSQYQNRIQNFKLAARRIEMCSANLWHGSPQLRAPFKIPYVYRLLRSYAGSK